MVIKRRARRKGTRFALFHIHLFYLPDPSNVQRMAAVKLWLEMEIGITGGEEVGLSPALAVFFPQGVF